MSASTEHIEILTVNGDQVGYVSYEECAALNPLKYWCAHDRKARLIGASQDKAEAERMVFQRATAETGKP